MSESEAAAAASPVAAEFPEPQRMDLKRLMSGIPEVVAQMRAPIPPGLNPGDREVLIQRRANLAVRVSFVHGLVLGLMDAGRLHEKIAKDEYQDLCVQVVKTFGSLRP